MTSSDQDIRAHVRDRYAAAALTVVAGSGASCCGSSEATQTSCCDPSDALSAISDTDEGDIFGAALYTPGDTDGLPEEAVLASLGCGNPLPVADLREGERVLDLGSGGGIDVLLSARRVGPTGFAYGLDMTDKMLSLARANAAKAGANNVEFVKGQIEDIPLPDSSIDVVISNCVINLSTDKSAVIGEMFRVLTPDGLASPMSSPRISYPRGTSRTGLLRPMHRRRPVSHRIPRRPHRCRVHRPGSGVHPPGRPRNARGDHPGNETHAFPMLRPRRASRVLRSSGKARLLRGGNRAHGRLRLPLTPARPVLPPSPPIEET
jgi:SAM-dependent methyltransferase